jgi:hypothetical protein
MDQMISPRDRRLISDFIDGQLKPDQRTRLEARLEAEASLRQALDDMARTCRLLRSQEPLRAPHNFTLTQAMVRGRKPAPLPTYPVFGLVSAVTALLLILVLAGDWLSTRGIIMPQPNVLEMTQVMSAQQPAGEAADFEAEQVGEESNLEPTAVAEAVEAQPMLEMAVEASATATPELLQAAPVEQPEPSAKSAPQESPPGTAADESARSMAPADAAESATGLLEAGADNAAGMGMQTYPYPDIYPYPEMDELRSAPTLFNMPRLLLTMIEILLGVAAAAFLVVFLLRRVKAHRA